MLFSAFTVDADILLFDEVKRIKSVIVIHILANDTYGNSIPLDYEHHIDVCGL